MSGHLINYFVLAEGSLDDASLEFDKLVNFLSSKDNFRVDIKGNEASIFNLDSGKTSFLRFKIEKKTKDTSFTNQIVYSIEQDDWQSAKSLNNAIKNYGYRLFNPTLGFFLVNSENLTDLSALSPDKKIDNIFKSFGLVPLFKYENSLVYYATCKKDKSIHLVNRHLLEFLSLNQKAVADKKYFSIKVADDISHFIALFDRGLIPISFYQTYFEGNKIINLSGYNVLKADENIIITPVFFEFVSNRQAFKPSQKTPFMKENIIQKGDSIENYLKQLDEGSFFKSKIICVKVAQDVSFEIGGDRKPVPRITVSIFLDEQSN